jgi:hypothetical protein
MNNHFVKNLLLSNNGQLAVSLVREFLESCQLDYTLSVFDPEINEVTITFQIIYSQIRE